MRKLDLTKSSIKFLESLPAKQFRQVAKTIFSLLKDAEPHDSQQMTGSPEYRRVDAGEYRIVYRVEPDVVKIAVVGKRNDGEVYRLY